MMCVNWPLDHVIALFGGETKERQDMGSEANRKEHLERSRFNRAMRKS
jgi:hypothetical protein